MTNLTCSSERISNPIRYTGNNPMRYTGNEMQNGSTAIKTPNPNG